MCAYSSPFLLLTMPTYQIRNSTLDTDKAYIYEMTLEALSIVFSRNIYFEIIMVNSK